jgi:hypothetical protein
MKKRWMFLFLFIPFLVSCASDPTSADTTNAQTTAQPTTLNAVEQERLVYRLLLEAEEMSGFIQYQDQVIRESGDLLLPTSYKGVVITYTSRMPEIISNQGIVTLPDECWIESRTQDGNTVIPNLNDNWPVIIDVLMTYQGQQRTAKLLLTVTPEAGFTCDKYKG